MFVALVADVTLFIAIAAENIYMTVPFEEMVVISTNETCLVVLCVFLAGSYTETLCEWHTDEED